MLAFLMSVVCILLSLLRHPGQFKHPQFWVEDSYLFFYSRNGSLSFLLEPVAGYLLLPQKLLALGFQFFAIDAQPLLYFITAILGLVAVVWSICVIPSRLPYSCLFAFAILLTPSGGEVYGKFLYLLWIIPLSALFLLFRDPSTKTILTLVFDVLIVLVAGLSGPLLLVLSPLFLFSYLRDRSLYNLSLLATVITTSAIQLCVIGQHRIPELALSTISHGLIEVFFQTFLGKYLTPTAAVSPILGLMIFSILILIVVDLKPESRFDGLLWLYACLLTAGAAIADKHQLISSLNPINTGARYFYIPYISLSCFLLLALIRANRIGQAVSAIALSLSLFNSLSHFQTNSIDYHWSDHRKHELAMNCSIRYPIPFHGQEGEAWSLRITTGPLCSDYSFSNWKSLGDARIQQIATDEIDVRTVGAAAGVVSTFVVEPSKSFAAFSTELTRTVPTLLGLSFIDEHRKKISDLSMFAGASELQHLVALIPVGTKFIYVYVSAQTPTDSLRIRAPSLILF